MWSADVCDADGNYLETVTARVPTDCPDAQTVARAISEASAPFMAA
jgi:hypothetical protein